MAGDVARPDDERALRLTFTYRAEEVELVDAQRVAMFVPPGDAAVAEGEPRSGFWVELRDTNGSPIFRQVMHQPIARDYEVFPEDPHGEIVRRPADDASGAFSVVIPEPAGAEHVVVMASPADPSRRTEAAAEVGRFAMVAVRRRASEYEQR